MDITVQFQNMSFQVLIMHNKHTNRNDFFPNKSEWLNNNWYIYTLIYTNKHAHIQEGRGKVLESGQKNLPDQDIDIELWLSAMKEHFGGI